MLIVVSVPVWACTGCCCGYISENILQVGKSATNVQDLGGLASQLTRDYAKLANSTRGACSTTANPEVWRKLDHLL